MLTEKHLTNKIKKIYSDAMPQIQASWDEYFERIKPEGQKLLDAIGEAKTNGTKKDIAIAERNYKAWLKDKQTMDLRYQAMLDETARQLTFANETAIAYINGTMPEFYGSAYNLFANEGVADYLFDLPDASTVKHLILDENQDLMPIVPQKKVDVDKTIKWNKKVINSEILQGTIQGESIPKIARRIQNVTNANTSASVRTARTMMTSAQNKGRQDSYTNAVQNGVVMKKVWMSAIDDRTRVAHLELDGQEVDVDEPFKINGYEIEYPCDPKAPPELVYNCRCAMKTKLIGFRKSDGTISYVDQSLHNADTRVIRNDKGKSVRVSTADADAKKDMLIESHKEKQK